MRNFYSSQSKGQAFAELSLIAVILLIMAWGAIEFGKTVSLSARMAAVAREAGRMINAQEYDPEQMEDTFAVITNMVAPANMETGGRVIVSFVQRVSGARTDFYTETPADTNRDYLVITDRFYYPHQAGDARTPAGSYVTNWTTELPETFDNGTTNASTRRYVAFSNNVGPVTLEMLSGSERTAVVEVFHTNQITAPMRALGVEMPEYLYDAAAF